MPTEFFKYASVNEYTLGNLRNYGVWFSQVGRLNDPFECHMSAETHALMMFAARRRSRDSGRSVDAELRMIIKHRKTEIPKLHKVVAEICDDARREYYFLSLTRAPYSPVMWAYYAQDFRGFCVKYSFEEDARWHFDPADPMTRAVVFNNQKTIHKVEYEAEVIEMLNGDGSYIKDCASNSLVRKHRDWSYEKEYRIMLANTSGSAIGYFRRVPNGSIKEIAIGFNMAKAQRDEIIAISKEIEVPVVKIEISKSKYEIIKTSPL